MENTLQQNDYVFVSRRHYTWLKNDIQRGDIIVFRSDLTTAGGSEKLLVKRVIGLPGETVSISDGSVFINGEAIDASYTKDGYTGGHMDEVTVPQGHIFVLGDNRQNSTDSRSASVGFVDINDIRGKVVFRLFPLKKAGSQWFVYEWLTLPKTFIATIDVICKFGLLYKAFTNDGDMLGQLIVDTTPNHCFNYAPRVEGEIPKLQDIKNYIILYNGWSRPVAVDFESKMVESGMASVQLCDFRNWCHGRFIFLSKHLNDSALVLFLTPREQQFAEDLIGGVTWRDKKDVFPRNTPIIKVETALNSPLATMDLLVKMYVLFDEIAKAHDEEPCSPQNPCGIDKRFPKNTPFKGLP